jgi:transcriptional regulator with XRE-family HTH domain
LYDAKIGNYKLHYQIFFNIFFKKNQKKLHLFLYNLYMSDNQPVIQGERLKKFREYLGITQQSMADLLGIDRPYLTQIEKGKKTISHSIATKVTNSYNELSINWLLSGEGSMILTSLSEVTPLDFGDKVHNVIELEEGALAADFIASDDASRHRAAVPAYMPGLPRSAAPYYSLAVQGDSMSPVLNNGDWLFCDLLTPDDMRKPVFHTPYIIAVEGVFLVKWLRYHAPDATFAHGSYEFISANAAYAPYREAAERINALLRVVAVLKPM